MTLADGYCHLVGFLKDYDLRRAEKAIASLFLMQAQKIGDYAINFDNPCGDPYSVVCAVNEELECGNDKEALYQVQKQFSQSQEIRALFDKMTVALCAVLKCWDNQLLFEGPGLFVSRPNDTRLKYKWHSEAHYYPKRRRFVNIWIPFFGDRTLADGAMSILPGSHVEHWDFAEYVGFNKDTEGKRNHFVQYEIPEKWLTKFKPHHCESKRGDVILFDRNLVHRSNVNKTKRYSFSLVARAYTPKDDLTLSGTMSATPYGGDIGRANLTVER